MKKYDDEKASLGYKIVDKIENVKIKIHNIIAPFNFDSVEIENLEKIKKELEKLENMCDDIAEDCEIEMLDSKKLMKKMLILTKKHMENALKELTKDFDDDCDDDID